MIELLPCEEICIRLYFKTIYYVQAVFFLATSKSVSIICDFPNSYFKLFEIQDLNILLFSYFVL